NCGTSGVAWKGISCTSSTGVTIKNISLKNNTSTGGNGLSFSSVSSLNTENILIDAQSDGGSFTACSLVSTSTFTMYGTQILSTTATTGFTGISVSGTSGAFTLQDFLVEGNTTSSGPHTSYSLFNVANFLIKTAHSVSNISTGTFNGFSITGCAGFD